MSADKSNRQTKSDAAPNSSPSGGPNFAARLREIVRGIATEIGSPDPREVTAAAIARLTPAQRAEALAICMPDWVRTELSRNTRHNPPPSPPKNRNDKRIRDWYARKLAGSVFTGDGWKFLRDCTAADLHAAALERYRKASETQAEGERWEKVALFMEEHARATVAEISKDELQQLMEAS